MCWISVNTNVNLTSVLTDIQGENIVSASARSLSEILSLSQSQMKVKFQLDVVIRRE